MGFLIDTVLYVSVVLLTLGSIAGVAASSFVGFIDPVIVINGVATRLWWLAFQGYTAYTVAIHTVAGVLMMLVGPLQFSTALRKRSRRVHRVLGYVYIASEVICLLSIGVTIPGVFVLIARGQQHGPVTARFLFDTLIHWCFETATLAFAFWRIWNRDFKWHRIGMMFNFAGMLSIPLWWTWFGILQLIDPDAGAQWQPNLFLMMFLCLTAVTIRLMHEFFSEKKQPTKIASMNGEGDSLLEH